MPTQTPIINTGTWGSLDYPKAEDANLEIQEVKFKPAKELVTRKAVVTRAITKLSWRNPTLEITLDAEVKVKSGLGALAIGRAPASALANFTDPWREHDPDDGAVLLADVEDSAGVDMEVALTTTMTFRHYPFVS